MQNPFSDLRIQSWIFFLKKCTLSVLDIHQLYKLQIEAVFKKGIVSFNAIAKPMKEN